MWNSTIGEETIATSGDVLGSRFLPASALADPKLFSIALQNLTAPASNGGPGIVQGLFIANSNRRGTDISMNTAWRDAVLHFIVTAGFPDWYNFTAAKPTLDRLTYDRVGILKPSAPNTGSYLNEGDAYDPNWQFDFFGLNYARLREIKTKYDPNSTLWCLACVGNEDWVEVEQQSGILCKAPWA
jgi:hypothetical protein